MRIYNPPNTYPVGRLCYCAYWRQFFIVKLKRPNGEIVVVWADGHESTHRTAWDPFNLVAIGNDLYYIRPNGSYERRKDVQVQFTDSGLPTLLKVGAYELR